jgi:ribonuclease R
MECERTANKYKQVEYMQNFLGDEFDAIISGVSQHGFWAETIEHKCEGMVSAMDLQEWDEFTFREHEYALVGLHSGFKFGMGDKIKVKVTATNLTKRQIDFALAEPRIPVRPRGKKKEKTKEQPIRDKKKKK